MASLRARLFAGLTALIVSAGFVAGGLAFAWAFNEAIELQDAILQQIGALAASDRLRTEPLPQPDIDTEVQVVVEEFVRAPGDRPIYPSRLNLPSNLPDGLQTIAQPDGPWRILVRTRSDGSRVAISQPTASRDEIARDSALRTVLPLAALVPCLMLLVGIVIDRSFRSVTQIAARLDARRPDDLEKLPTGDVPRELRPFIGSINRLLERIGALFDQRRRFIAHAAHELRTPITALSIQALNLGHLDLSGEGQERLAALKRGIGRTAHLLEQLLDLAKYEATDASESPITSFDQVAREVVADLVPLAHSRSIDLGFEQLDAVPVRAEPTALGVLIRNLIDNAIRHSPAGGRIDVRLGQDGRHAVLEVEDSGLGVPEAELGRLSEPFFRGSAAAGQGSGLGLSIVRTIVDRHGGFMVLNNLTSPDRSGLHVKVTLPASDHAE